MLIRKGDRGDVVLELERALWELWYYPGEIDGIFDDVTESIVVAFQEDQGLYADGIVGPNTLGVLERELRQIGSERFMPNIPSSADSNRIPIVRVDADAYGEGYDRFYLRADAAEAYQRVRDQVVAAGGLLTSSGSRRSLNASVGASRSATSFHYTARALDLHIWSGMVDAENDPYVAVYEGDRRFRIYARAENGEEMTLQAATYDHRTGGPEVSGRFIDLTSIFESEGYKSIRGRRSFFNSTGMDNRLGAEWWHFQYEEGLIAGVSTFGNELLQVYSESELEGTPPWDYRNRVFKVNWF